MKKTRLSIQGLGVEKVIDKLAKEGIALFDIKILQKNTLIVGVRGKDLKKVFAILRGSCYNIKKVRLYGLLFWRAAALKSAGLILGAVVFCFAVCFFQTRILRVRVVGSGAYYEQEIKHILNEGNGKILSPVPKDYSCYTVQILSLPRVSFCSFANSGGILTVRVEVSEERLPIEGVPLAAPTSGILEDLVVVRGTPLIAVGEPVVAGQILVDCKSVYGESVRSVLVIARARVRYDFSVEYSLSEEDARAQLFLDYGTTQSLVFTPTQEGVHIEGKAFLDAELNFT